MKNLLENNFPAEFIAYNPDLLDNLVLQEFIVRGRAYAGETEGQERERMLTEFVNLNVPYVDDMRSCCDLVAAIVNGGVCEHQAALLQLVAVADGMDAKRECGRLIYEHILGDEHNWITVGEGPKKRMLDATNMIYGHYSDFSILPHPLAPSYSHVDRLGPLKFLKQSHVMECHPDVLVWDWLKDMLDFKELPPSVLYESSAGLKDLHEDFLRKARRSRRFEHHVIAELESKVTRGDPAMDCDSAYDLWVTKSNEEVARLTESCTTAIELMGIIRKDTYDRVMDSPAIKCA